MRLTWVQPEDLVAHELVQAAAEGADVTVQAGKWSAAGGSLVPVAGGASEPGDPELRELARGLLDELDRLTAALRSTEELDPAGWTEPPPLPVPAEEALLDRLHGAWLGRAAGCLLGKPVEKIPRAGIEEIARATGNWPIRGYFTEAGLPAEVAARWPWNRRSRPTSLAENIDGMPEDDDLNFAMLALELVERHGGELSTEQVAESWLTELPAGRVFTAERAAYRNLLEAVPPALAAVVRNPFREWIGALIRADVYGWVRPGDPHAAARLAYVDARLSHRRNGVYGAMFVAAMSAAAVTGTNVHAVVHCGLSVVPPDSALAEAVRFGADLGGSGLPLEAALDELHAVYGALHWVHVLNNAALIAYALVSAEGEFGAAVAAAVAAGWDTDSAGATVGAVCGALAGAAGLPEQWTKPLRNRIASSLPGFDRVAIDELARRTLAVAAR
ncbi:ADP-ribosylglycohydrolase family protein [Amycolatopsis nigrescens]|uniref:ADP-ribosylglycohydrolase family protein n=1 Tax=Amycolatopsis nigrescens TaxID=381445 RepID=UPI000362295C|nr:ADP-ribosylglycohydrolase family protein [Amycolatopsis nigrescens]